MNTFRKLVQKFPPNVVYIPDQHRSEPYVGLGIDSNNAPVQQGQPWLNTRQ